MFIFSFCLEAKRKNEPKKKNSLINSNAIRHCTRPLNAVIYVFAYFRQKSFSAAKTTPRAWENTKLYTKLYIIYPSPSAQWTIIVMRESFKNGLVWANASCPFCIRALQIISERSDGQEFLCSTFLCGQRNVECIFLHNCTNYFYK